MRRPSFFAHPVGFVALGSTYALFPILRVWPFGGMRPPGFIFTGLVSSHQIATGDFLHLVWPSAFGLLSFGLTSCWLLPGHPACCPTERCRIKRPHVEQASPDKEVNFRCMVRQAHHVLSWSKDTTAAFTILNPGLCYVVPIRQAQGANLPGGLASYAIPVRWLIALHPGLPLLLVALACGSPFASLKSFRRCLAVSSPAQSPGSSTCLRLVFLSCLTALRGLHTGDLTSAELSRSLTL